MSHRTYIIYNMYKVAEQVRILLKDVKQCQTMVKQYSDSYRTLVLFLLIIRKVSDNIMTVAEHNSIVFKLSEYVRNSQYSYRTY